MYKILFLNLEGCDCQRCSIIIDICKQHGRAQGGININLYGSYVFDDKFDTYYSSSSYFEGKIKGGFQWGIGVEYMVHPEYGIELLYYRQDTNAPTRYYGVVGRGKWRSEPRPGYELYYARTYEAFSYFQ